MYGRLIELAGEGKAYLSVIYNIALIAFLAIILGLLMGKISELVGRRKQIDPNLEDPNKADIQR